MNGTLQKATFLHADRLLYTMQNLLWYRQGLPRVLLPVLMMRYFFRKMRLGSLLNNLPGNLNSGLLHKVILYKCATQVKLHAGTFARLKRCINHRTCPWSWEGFLNFCEAYVLVVCVTTRP